MVYNVAICYGVRSSKKLCGRTRMDVELEKVLKNNKNQPTRSTICWAETNDHRNKNGIKTTVQHTMQCIAGLVNVLQYPE